ncbi:GvpL/GvpF family gas vesicle protein [Streptomyces sp. NPDC049954]|uniref:GvpL/GvpF family gas vesicle protein n=1 Tax=Streptomyces sp. NPDC049954 TaxID=3155779 RepID=UPI00341C59B4
MSVYVYAVVGAGHELAAGLRGVGERPSSVALLRNAEGEPAAVTGAAPTGLRARRRDLNAHQDVLETLMRSGPVLPMRFGVVLPDERTVRDQLTAHAAEYAAVLERVEGRVEFNVKALPVQDETALATLLREDPALRELRRSTSRRPAYEANVRFGRAVAEALTRRAARCAERVRAALEERAAEVSEGPEVDACVLNTSYLVPRGTEAAFRALVERQAAAERGRIEVRLTGPLPCYSFVGSGSARTVPASSPSAAPSSAGV